MSLNEIVMGLEIGLIYGIVALGIFLTFRIIDFPDLTCDGSFVLGSAVSSILIQSGFNPWISLGMAAFAGAVAGGITGLLHRKLKLTDLLSGILVGFMLYSINLRVMGGVPNISLMDDRTIFGRDPLITLTAIGFGLTAIMAYGLMTDFGLALRSIGQNKKLARNSGVNVGLMTILGLGLSNGVIALAGGLLSQHQGFADIGSGIGTVIVGLASVMIGEKLIPSPSMITRIVSCFIGSIAYRLFIGFALHSDSLGLTSADLNFITGLMIIAIMGLPRRGGYAQT